MVELGLPADGAGREPADLLDRLTTALKAAGPPLLFGLRLWLSVCLALYVAFWLQLDNAYWAGTSAAIVCQPSLGASLRKGWFRMIGTLVGAVVIVLITACFPQDRALFLVSLALWGAGCAFLATLLRNFAAYAAALAGYTAAIIASDQMGAAGGPNGDAFMLALSRVSEISIGIIAAGIVLGATDLGGTRRRLGALFAGLCAEIAARFTGTLTTAGGEFPEIQAMRRSLLQRVIALDAVIDEALGESSELRYRSQVLQSAADGFLVALAGWRSVAVRLFRLPRDQARREAETVLAMVPLELRAPAAGDTGWLAAPGALRQLCEKAFRRLVALPVATPSARLLAVQTAQALAGLAAALNGMALLAGEPARPVRPRRGLVLHVPDWLPSLVNAGRAFAMIGAAEIFWIATAWPSGAAAVTWVAVAVILFAPRADQAYASTSRFMAGNCLAVAFAAAIEFALLPGRETFAGLSLAIGFYLVPVGALMTQSWQPIVFLAMAANFIPLLAPTNQMTYDTQQFYNNGLAIVAGSCAAALSFRLLPPPSPAFRTRRLLALTLRDLRKLATGPIRQWPQEWRDRIYPRLSALPAEATPLQRAQLLAALSVGAEIIQLRRIARRLGIGAELDSALEGLADGDGTAAERLARLDRALASRSGAARAVLRARSLILAISEALAQHAAYFEPEAAR